MITVTPQVLARIEAGDPPIELVRFDFAGTPPIFLTTSGYDVSWGGHTWLSNGFMLDTDGYSRASELRAKDGNIGLTGVDLSIAAILLAQSQVNRLVTIYNAWLNPSGGVTPDPYIRDKYFIDDITIEQGLSSANIVLGLSGEWADFEIKKGFRTTDTSLQRVHPGDEFFRYSKDIKKDLRWGGK
jgi:hypothetical protein